MAGAGFYFTEQAFQMKIVPSPHPHLRFRTKEDAAKAMDCFSKGISLPPDLAVMQYQVIGNMLTVTEEFKQAPYELVYVQLEDGEVIPKNIKDIDLKCCL
jgi:hypothetical protein